MDPDRVGMKWVVEGQDADNAWWVGPGRTKVRCLDAAVRFTSENSAKLYAAVMEAEAFQILE